MKIPDKFTIPDWILDAVRVAPDGTWEPPSDPATARALLGELRTLMQSPPILAVICDMAIQLINADDEIDKMDLTGMHTLVKQQQLIGEKRGLRRFFVLLDEVHEQLAQKLTSNE